MAQTQIDTTAFLAEFPTLDQATIDRLADEVVAEASLYAPNLASPTYVATAGIKALLSRAVRGQLQLVADKASGPRVTSMTAGPLALKLIVGIYPAASHDCNRASPVA